MASNTHKPFPSRNLKQLLQEKQEPFKLKVYLLERGYYRTKANLNSFGSFDSPKFLKKNKETKMMSRFSKSVRALASKIVSVNKNFDTNCEKRITRKEKRTTEFYSCSMYNRSCMENKQQQQLSPVSVLEEAHSDQNSPVHNVDQETSLENSSAEKQLIDAEFSLDYSKIKLQLRKTPQLLFDCVKEVIQKYKLKNSKQKQQDFLGAEEIGRLLRENVLEWSKQSTKLIKFDLPASFEDWKYDSQEQRLSIAKVIGDTILDDIVIDEIVNQETHETEGMYTSKFVNISS